MPEQPLPPQGSRSPIHAVADPGITDSWAMPRVPPSAPLLGLVNCHLGAPSPSPSASSPGSGGRAAHSEVGITQDFSNFRSVPTHQPT